MLSLNINWKRNLLYNFFLKEFWIDKIFNLLEVNEKFTFSLLRLENDNWLSFWNTTKSIMKKSAFKRDVFHDHPKHFWHGEILTPAFPVQGVRGGRNGQNVDSYIILINFFIHSTVHVFSHTKNFSELKVKTVISYVL